jgi:pimeloyl-ACP methyl ester carboxylesterase
MKKLFLLTLLFTAVYLNSSAQNKIPYGNNPLVGKYASINGIKLYYEIYGKGEPLLLLHGNGGSIGSRFKEIEDFAKKYQVIALDSRCHGKSQCMKSDLTYEMMASDVNALLESLKIDSCLIWGHSDGGILALIMGYEYPKKVKKMLISGANIQPDTTALFPTLVDAIKMYPMLPDTLQQKHLKLMAFHPNIPFAKLKKISAPTLVMAGDRDAIREEHTIKIFQNIPNSQLCILPGTTHYVADEKPHLFRAVLYDFFDKPFQKPSMVENVKAMLAEQMKAMQKKNEKK